MSGATLRLPAKAMSSFSGKLQSERSTEVSRSNLPSPDSGPRQPHAHLKLPVPRFPALLPGHLFGLSNQARILGGNGRGGAIAEQVLHQFPEIFIHLWFRGERDIGWFTVGSLDQPDLGMEWLQALDISLAPAEVSLNCLANVFVPVSNGLEERRGVLGISYRMRVYVPFGSRWLPYFMRRIAERAANLYFVLRGIAGA